MKIFRFLNETSAHALGASVALHVETSFQILYQCLGKLTVVVLIACRRTHRVVCPKFGHPALTSSFTKDNLLQQL